MARVIKRYESRKLYDTEESRYVSLDEIAGWVRDGREVHVVDNATDEDVTTQTLTQVILEEGRNGKTFLPSELLHELVRFGSQAFTSGVGHVQEGVDRFVRSSMDRLAPVREAREEMSTLRERLEELEGSLRQIEGRPSAKRAPGKTAKKRAKAAKKAVAKKAAPKKKAPKKTGKPPASRKGASS